MTITDDMCAWSLKYMVINILFKYFGQYGSVG